MNMNTNEITTGQTAELIALFAKKMPLDMSSDVAQGWIENPDGFERTIRMNLLPPAATYEIAPIPRDWSKFYKKYFGIVADFSAIRIPAKVAGFDRLIVVAEGVSINQVYETGKKNFGSWKWCGGDIESNMRVEERGPVKTVYAIWIRNGQEADDDLKNLSAEMIAERKIDTENLLERLLHGFKFWSETKTHLDIETITLCASSRYAGGHVPDVSRLNDGDVRVCRCGPQRADPRLRARRAGR
jgi:hypothetical protein